MARANAESAIKLADALGGGDVFSEIADALRKLAEATLLLADASEDLEQDYERHSHVEHAAQ